jgi:hypothetical protein
MVEPAAHVPPPGNNVDILAVVIEAVTLTPQKVCAFIPIGRKKVTESIRIKKLQRFEKLER